MSEENQFQVIKSDRLYVKVADQIKSLIESKVFKPGDRLPSERDLAEKLGVSRPTIRESMIALELSQVIEIRTGSGIYVSPKADKKDIILTDKGIGPFEILEMRYILESEVCALAAARITNDEIAELKALIEEMEAEEKLPTASEQADRKFHLTIAKASQNSAIYATIDWLWQLRINSDLSNKFLQQIRKEGVHPSIDDHKKIIFALEQRNPDKARYAMKSHIENATINAAKHFEK